MKKKIITDAVAMGDDGMQAMGSVGQRLLSNGMSSSSLRPWIGADGHSYINVNGVAVRANAATLRKDEWKQYDTAVVEAARQRMVGVGDLVSRGLTYTISNGLGTTVLEYEDMSDMEAAEINMDGVTRGQKDRVEYGIKYLPLPIVHKDFQINARVLNASRTTGQPLDTTQAALAGQVVAEKIESILFTGSSTYTFGGGTIYGYMDFPYRSTVTLTQNWDASGKTGAEILTDVMSMKQASINDRHYGPWVLYVPTGYETVLDEDHKAESDSTVRERILRIAGITDVKVSDKLTANNVLLVQMTADTVRMVSGMPVTPVEWSTEGGMIFNYKVMTIQVPQIRADQNNRSGIVHLA